jgi:hypothetical protein
MRSVRFPPKAILLVTGLVILICSASASPGITATFGDKVPLSGYSYGSPWVYLFLTGPNLPVNGVALNDISKHADQGGFTVVDVDGNDHWTYTWNTASVGGRLDAGTYTIWVANGPNDRSRLAQADYSTITITLGKPSITVDTPAQPGGMDLQSVPDGASLMVNGEYRGKTPLTINDLPAGTYNVTFSRFGSSPLSTPVKVEQGKVSEVHATLIPRFGDLAVNTSPPGARILIDGAGAGISPVTVSNLTAEDHTVTIEKDGYIPVTRPIRIIAGQLVSDDVTLELLTPPPATRTSSLLPIPLTGVGVMLLLLACSHLHRT